MRLPAAVVVKDSATMHGIGASHYAVPPEMFSEEYQAEMLTRYVELFRTLLVVIGENGWSKCGPKPGEAVYRVGSMNLKGVPTRDRRTKLADSASASSGPSSRREPFVLRDLTGS